MPWGTTGCKSEMSTEAVETVLEPVEVEAMADPPEVAARENEGPARLICAVTRRDSARVHEILSRVDTGYDDELSTVSASR